MKTKVPTKPLVRWVTPILLLVGLGWWIFLRIQSVNPAILGDEYLYSMNSRHASPWGVPFSGDYSNYLFNLVYSSTSLCGPNFYTCAKLLNLAFFLAFIFMMYQLAAKYLPYWAALSFLVAAALSPLSVYTSMFLPESMFFFSIGWIIYLAHRAMLSYSLVDLSLLGLAFGVSSLIKPHAWLALIPVVIVFTIVGITQKQNPIKSALTGLSALLLAAVVSRIIVGFAIAGPKAIGFFGSYVNSTTIPDIVSPGQDSISEVDDPLSVMASLFPEQMAIHGAVIVAILGLSMLGVTLGLIDIVRSKALSGSTALALLSAVWLLALVIEIVLFTGWVTSTGDDHSQRVLLRYYEYLFILVPLSGLSVIFDAKIKPLGYMARWPIALGLLALSTPAFTGFFASLVVQIADAPTLAGLIVNYETTNTLAIASFLGLMSYAVFPRVMPYMLATSLAISMVWTGWNIQDQYIGFRGDASPEDIAGTKLSDELAARPSLSSLVIADSRFKATNIAFWADSPLLTYDLMLANASISGSLLDQAADLVVAPFDFEITDGFEKVAFTSDYNIWARDGGK